MKMPLLQAFTAASALLLVLAVPATRSFGADDGKRAEWVQKHEEQKAQHAQLAADLATARVDYSRGRSTRHLRGEGKAGLIDEIRRLEEELAKSERALQDFPEQARRAGALPGWFRDDGPAAPAINDGAARARRGRSGGSQSLSERGAKARQMQNEPAETAVSDTSGRHEDSAPSRRSLSSRRAEERESRRLGGD